MSELKWLPGNYQIAKSYEHYLYANYIKNITFNRTIGKRCDGDLTRFAQMSKKPRDDAQRWRAFKNIVRFYRNPLGYTYWKTQPFFQQNRVRIVYVLLFYHMYNTLMLVVQCRGNKRKMIEDYASATGRSSKNFTGLSAMNRMPQDMKKNYVRYSNFHQMRRNKQVSKMHLPWWSRDQNFRKYFEMRKKHGIEPSLSGFANDKHYEKFMKKATNFY